MMAKFIKMAISRNSDINSFCRMNRMLWWIYSKALIKYKNTTHISKSCSFFIYRRYLIGKEPSRQLILGKDSNGGGTPCNKSTDWCLDVITIEILFWCYIETIFISPIKSFKDFRETLYHTNESFSLFDKTSFTTIRSRSIYLEYNGRICLSFNINWYFLI